MLYLHRYLVLFFCTIVLSLLIGATTAMIPIQSQHRTVQVWLQVTDSCMQALSGATFTVRGAGINEVTPSTKGTAPQSLPTYAHQCPVQQGTCMNFSTGCTFIAVPLGETYTITIDKTATGYGSNVRYAICEGGSDCPHGPERATIHVSASGGVSATVLNYYPDGDTVRWPTNKESYSGTQGDPILFHEFGVGNGSIQCDGDHDADDYLTGTPGQHCNSDKDKK